MLPKLPGISHFKIVFVTVVILASLVSLMSMYSVRRFDENDQFVFCNIEDAGIGVGGEYKDKWQDVDKEKSAYVFSAYLIPDEFYTDWFSKFKVRLHNILRPPKNDADPKTIMLVGATSSYNLTFYCQLWYHTINGSSTILVTRAFMLDLDTNDFRYQSCLFACALPDKRVPNIVSLTSAKCSAPMNKFKLVAHTKAIKHNFTVCLCPMFEMTKMSHARRFIEWVELNRLLGANHFLVYNFSVGEEMNRALRIFEKKRVVEVIPWVFSIDIYYFAQHAALNDCLLRSRFTTKYVINSDIDEFIIPHCRGIFTWNDMIGQMPQESAYSFTSHFFPVPAQLNNVSDNKASIEQTLITLTNFKRYKTKDARVKYMVEANTAQRMGIHNAYDLRWGREKTVSSSVGFIHHYRSDATIKEIIEDTVVRDKFGNLLSQIMKSYKEFFNGSKLS